jgi:flagellar protein FlaG
MNSNNEPSVTFASTPSPPAGVRETLASGRPFTAHTTAPSSKPPEPVETIDSIVAATKTEKARSVDTLQENTREIEEAIDTLNNALARSPTSAKISRDEDLNRFIVKIMDDVSGEIVREIPSEALLKFARNLRELKGLLFDKAL